MPRAGARKPAKIPCATCGALFSAPKTGRKGGRPRKHCAKCSHSGAYSSPERETASRQRAKALERDRGRAKRSLERTRSTYEAARLAAILGVVQDAGTAAGLAGIAGEADELEGLLVSAREHHGDLLLQERSGLARRIYGCLSLLTVELTRQAALVQPGQLGHAIGALMKALDLLSEAESADSFVPITMEIVSDIPPAPAPAAEGDPT